MPLPAALNYTDAAMNISAANAASVARGNPLPGLEPLKDTDELAISTDTLGENYPLWSSSLLNLIQTCEKRIDFRNKQ